MSIGSPKNDVSTLPVGPAPATIEYPEGVPVGPIPPAEGTVVIGQTAQAVVPEAIDWATELTGVTTVPVVEAGREVNGQGRVVFADPVPQTVAQKVKRILLADIVNTTVDEVLPTVPPNASPVPEVLPFPGGAIYVRFAPVTGAVSYQLHVSTTDADPPSAATRLTARAASPTVVRTLADGSPLPSLSTGDQPMVYVAIVAANEKGAAEPSNWFSARPGQVDPAFLQLLVGDLIAERLFGELIEAVTIMGAEIIGSVFRTGLTGARVVIRNTGNGGLIEFFGRTVPFLPATIRAVLEGDRQVLRFTSGREEGDDSESELVMTSAMNPQDREVKVRTGILRSFGTMIAQAGLKVQNQAAFDGAVFFRDSRNGLYGISCDTIDLTTNNNGIVNVGHGLGNPKFIAMVGLEGAGSYRAYVTGRSDTQVSVGVRHGQTNEVAPNFNIRLHYILFTYTEPGGKASQPVYVES